MNWEFEATRLIGILIVMNIYMAIVLAGIWESVNTKNRKNSA